ncbi:MAG: hypothetical protein ACYCR3_11350, partial [Acidithiobacillus sp.]
MRKSFDRTPNVPYFLSIRAMNKTTSQNNPTNVYTVPSVSITTARTGASAKANALGMSAMQER